MVIGQHEVNFPAVVVDNIGGAAQATQHLIDLNHTRIGFIGGPKNSSTVTDRLKGYKSTLAQNGIAFDGRLIRWGNFTPKSGYQAATTLLKEGDQPTSIFDTNDQMAFGVIYAVRELGLKVPDDVAVVGFDNIPMSSYFIPPLTTIEIPINHLGVASMVMLIKLISQIPFSPLKWFKTRLIVRDSSGTGV